MSITTLTLSDQAILKLKQQCADYPMRSDIAHTLFQVKLPDGAITVYQSKKVVFSGQMAQEISQSFQTQPIIKETTTKLNATGDMAGSDEVGTGDYFGPVVVSACYITKADYHWLHDLAIMDSKAMTDATILKVAPILMEKLTYSLLVLDNEKYNKVHQTMNLNTIKARLHHSAYQHLQKKLSFLPELCVVDQFMPKDKYFQQLDDDYGITQLHFETKAENKYLAVACASVIARYAFLMAIKQMSEYYDFIFPLGAGAGVDIKGKQLLVQHPDLDLKKVAKVHFKNTLRITQ